MPGHRRRGVPQEVPVPAMADTPLNYEKMVEDAMRGVAREALREVASRGIPGGHQIYIGFKTGAPEVEIPDHLRAQ